MTNDVRDLTSIDAVQAALAEHAYVSERSLAVAIYLALKMERPLLLEGEAGVGKTEVAKVLASVLGRRLIRLQCYEGLDVHTAVYEWDYARQILQIRLMEAAGQVKIEAAQKELFSPEFLLKRPLLQALDLDENGRSPVLLIDEIDRADEAFEAFLLEVLSDFQVTVPEIGALRAPIPPLVIITSNRTREVHDALRRRCFYHWIDYPDAQKELAIVLARAPDTPAALARKAVAFVQMLRHEDLYKRPGVAETLDWVKALALIGETDLAETSIATTLGALLKHREDIERAVATLPHLLNAAAAPSP